MMAVTITEDYPGEIRARQEEAQPCKGDLTMDRELREQARYSAGAVNLSLQHCQAMTEEYRQIMSMIVRPIAPANDGEPGS